MIPPVVDAAWLAEHPDAVLVDVRYTPTGGVDRDGYLAGHLPGAIFLSMDDLAGPATPETGRHPLPEPAAFAEAMAASGIGDDTTVIAYDGGPGAFAARLVWMLRMLGRDAALLDGGLSSFDGELEEGAVETTPATFTVQPWDPSLLATIDDACTQPVVVDARAPERYAGTQEPLDPRAGHIPGALNVPFAGNLDTDGTFRSPEAIAERFAAAGITDATGVVVYCGSGVTACHDLIALEYAGLGQARLYPGSWSQYSATERPLATGLEPGTRPSIDPHGVTH